MKFSILQVRQSTGVTAKCTIVQLIAYVLVLLLPFDLILKAYKSSIVTVVTIVLMIKPILLSAVCLIISFGIQIPALL